VGDATGRLLDHVLVSVSDKMCVFEDAGIVAPCNASTDDDGIVHFVMDRGLTPEDARVTEHVRVDPDVLNVTVDVDIACGDNNSTRLATVYRSARGRIVVREALHGAEGCGNVLLVHGMKITGLERCGYGGGESTWCDAATLLANAGYGVAEFLYPTEGRVQVSAMRLGALLSRMEKLTGVSKWFVVAHSFGGLVVRECMSGGDALCASRVQSLVTLGTPHEGVSLWCAMFSCKPRVQLTQGSAYMGELARRPLLMTPVTAVAGSIRMAISCTPLSSESDGIVLRSSALPEAFAADYTTKVVPRNHTELACMKQGALESLEVVKEMFADAGGCALPCVAKEDECGKGFSACCSDKRDNDCDGRTDIFDGDCFDDGTGEF